MLDHRSAVLAALPDAARSRLVQRAVARSLTRGEVLLLAGDEGDRVYLVRRGLLKLVARSLEGKETILGLAAPGDLVGDVAALDGGAQPLDAVAATRCTVLGMDADGWLAAVGASPEASLALALTAVGRLRWVCRTAFERSAAVVPARLAGRLLDLAELLGSRRGGVIELDVPLVQEDIAGLAGMCRESACKVLTRLRAQGVLDYRGRRLRIFRPDVLERLRYAERASGPCRSAGGAGGPLSRWSGGT